MQWFEQLGDPVTTLGGAVVPNQRTAPQFSASIGTYAADGQTDTVAARLRIRRQMRSLLNNSPLKLGAFLYLVYSDDPENDGWYVPDQTQLQDYAASAGLATGFWQLASSNWYVAGKQRTHREARQIWMKDLRTGLYARDALGWIYSTDFSALTALALTALPSGETQAALTVSGQVVPTTALPTGRDGGVATIATGLSDLQVVSFERPESAINLSDVIAYDRRGQITAPTTGPDTLWEEAYGPDYPWNWLTSGQAQDTPVLDNGLVRVRYDASASTTIGFRVEVWNGSAYVEQGKMVLQRRGDTTTNDTVWVSAGLVEYTPDRAVMKCVLSSGTDIYSRESVFITMQRGEYGLTFEAYPAPKAAGGISDVDWAWCLAPNSGVADLNDSVIKNDTQSSLGTPASPQNTGSAPCVIVATATGTGHTGAFAAATIGATSFATSENWVSILRCPTAAATVGPYEHTLSVLQGANALAATNNLAFGYATATNTIGIISQNAAGYVSCGLSFSPAASDQVNEAEGINSGGTIVSSGVPATTASGGSCVKDTQTNYGHDTLAKATTTLIAGVYRWFARVWVTTGATGSFQMQLGGGSGLGTQVNVTTTGTWTWIDLGEFTFAAAGAGFHMGAWTSNASDPVYVDRVEGYLTQDRTRTTAIYSGARDAGQAALYDARTLGALVAR